MVIEIKKDTSGDQNNCFRFEYIIAGIIKKNSSGARCGGAHL
jgi:hypothetical protein